MTSGVLETETPIRNDVVEASPRRWAALYVLCIGMLMIVVDGTVVNVALPSIQSDLGFSASGLAWVVNAYLIAFGGLLLLAGRMGDLLGRRKVFLVGLAVFTVASLACALSFSAPVLIVARLVQGGGGALSSAGILGMIVTMFPDPRERTKALGVYGFVASSGGSIGLLAGGVLTQSVGWHSIFVINLPIGIATAVLALRYVPDHVGPGLSEGLDVIGGALLTGGVMVGVLAILGASDGGWLHALEGVAALGLIAAFVVRQARVAVPLIPLRLFRSRNVSGASVVQALMVVGMFGMFFLAALYLQEIKGFSALEVGVTFLPTTLVMASVSLWGAQPLAARLGERRVVMVGTLIVGAGLLILAFTPAVGSPLPTVLPATILLGFGAGMSFPSIMSLGMSSVEGNDAGAASGLLNTSLQVGGALGLAVLASLAAGRTRSLTASGHSSAVATTSGYHLAYLVGAALLVVASVVAATVFRAPAGAAQGDRALAVH